MRQFRISSTVFAVTISLTLLACSKNGGGNDVAAGSGSEVILESDWVPRAKFIAEVGSDGAIRSVAPLAITGNPAKIPISVVASSNVKMEVDSSGFVIPPITFEVLSFGDVKISDLKDNDLRVCGTNGKTKCSKAVIRVYTEADGAGLWNKDHGYGAPLGVALGTSAPSVIGWKNTAATVVQTYTIPSNKNNLKLSDFSPNPVYKISADFTDAGAGSFATTLVIEYGLLP